MDANIQRALHDRVYERRKAGALDIEKLVRDALNQRNWDKIASIIDQLVHEYAYAIHQPYARNGGLIGLAAASIALGTEVIRYLREIVPPVLACFNDQDARVRYYACESMYNIAKTTKGEILPYFNQIFDALSKLAADSEISVKNGSELLDRLLKDIISNSATSYISILPPENKESKDGENSNEVAFSLPRLIPLLSERILVINPFTRMFLVEWITLLDSIPDLFLITYLPAFLKGLFRFLNDSSADVATATQHILERFLNEITQIAKIKQEISERRKASTAEDASTAEHRSIKDASDEKEAGLEKRADEDADQDTDSALTDDDTEHDDDEYIPGQDVAVDHAEILRILITVLGEASEEHIQLAALKWIDTFFDICPGDILLCAPDLLNQLLPALSSNVEQVRHAGDKVNSSLMTCVSSLPDEETPNAETKTQSGRSSRLAVSHRDGASVPDLVKEDLPRDLDHASLDYEACVNSLTMQFLDEHEATRVASLSWLIMLQRKAPRKVLAAHDGTFPALLKTLSDPSDAVVTRDLQLLSQISQRSDDAFFSNFMVNLLKLFGTDKQLLQTRGNLIIRQLCMNLSPERIYRTMAECLDKDEDLDFVAVMVSNLNNNLITAPELAELRRKLRYGDAKETNSLFVTLFKAWCHNAVATLCLCLLAQAYEQAYSILQTFADIEMTVDTLIQIDKLIQLLESPVFTYLRLHLLEPAQHPHLYKTLYGILMLLPQSAAFASLKNRLNAVSAIGYLSVPTPPQIPPTSRANSTSGPSGLLTTGGGAVSSFERSNRIKMTSNTKDEPIKWNELLERFRTVQERTARAKQLGPFASGVGAGEEEWSLGRFAGADQRSQHDGSGRLIGGALTSHSILRDGRASPLPPAVGQPGQGASQQLSTSATRENKEPHKSRFSAAQFGRNFVQRASGKEKDKRK